MNSSRSRDKVKEQKETKSDNTMSRQTTSVCRICKLKIPKGARKCHHCGSYQSRWYWLSYAPVAISLVMMFVAITQAILGYIQLNEARRERILSSQALDRAKVAEGIAKSAAKQASSDANDIAALKQRVKNQSATIDLVAKTATNAQKDVSRLQDVTDFSLTVIAAQNDNRRAYDQIWAWSKDSLFPFQKLATQAVQTVMDQHDPPFSRSNFSVPWNEGLDPQKLSLPELWQQFKKSPRHIRLGILEFVWKKRTDISKRERLQFLVDVLRIDQSLTVVEYAGRYFAQGTGDKYKPIAIGPHLKWWEENKDLIE
jgi:ribosomal protein L40E